MTIALIQDGGLIKEFISLNDATIIGVLVSVIILLIWDRNTIKKELAADREYIRDQEKANLKMLLDLSGAIDGLGKDVTRIHSNTENNGDIAKSILVIVKERLNKT